MINNLGSKALETKIDDYMGEYVSDYISTYVSSYSAQIEAQRKVLDYGFNDFVIPAYETAPNTIVQNRAQVCRSLKAIAGVERLMVRGIDRLSNEFGPSGQQVWEPSDKDSRIRFVGSGWISSATTSGQYIGTTTVNDICEITFYGTGLNLLINVNSTTADFKASIDGAAYGTNLFVSTYSGILDARNYSQNTILRVSSGLVLGWHTIKIRLDVTNLRIHGFEILNERTDLAVYSGEGLSNGYSNSLSALATSTFSSGISGTRGGRVVKYVQNNILNTVVQAVDAAAAYLAAANHINEEVVRRINFREFGVNRADDFSTLTTSASSRVFTLDDGITTLIGQNNFVSTANGVDGIIATGNTDFTTITFVGTGLDIFITGTGVMTPFVVTIDNVSIGSITPSASAYIAKVCSGLPYGTHVIKFANASGTTTDTAGIVDFIIYQPKKPTVPSDGFEVADYNVVANYAISANAVLNTVPTGAIRKFGSREVLLSGTWVAPSVDLASFNCGLNTRTITAAGFVEYTFWGTGIEFRTSFNSTSVYSQTYSIDGSTNLSSYTSALVTATTGLTFTASTGVLAGTASGSNPGLVRINGLSLGLHRIKILSNNVAPLYVDAFDVITPIHINDNSLKVGSISVKSVNKFSPEKVQSNAGPDLSKAKAWALLDGGTSKILASYNISAVIFGSTPTYIYFEKPFKTDNYVIIGTTTGASTFNQHDATTRKRNFVSISNWRYDTSYTLGPYYIACFGELFDE